VRIAGGAGAHLRAPSTGGICKRSSGTLQSVRSLRGNVATMPKAPFRRRGRNTVHMSQYYREPLVETMDYSLEGPVSVMPSLRARCGTVAGRRLLGASPMFCTRTREPSDRPDSSRDSRLGRNRPLVASSQPDSTWQRRPLRLDATGGGRRGAQCCQVDTHRPT